MAIESLESAGQHGRLKGILFGFILMAPQLGCAALGPTEPPDEEISESGLEIIGGSEALVGEFPWQVQLSIPGYPHWCGGSVVDNDWVLTASHCVDGLSASDFTVRAGLHQISAPGGSVQTRSVQQIVMHPDYDSWTIENDIALLRLATPLTYTVRVQPVALRSTDPPALTSARVSGWGNTFPGSGASDVLMKATLPVQTNATCNNAGTLPLLVRDSMICAGYVSGTSGGCHGDSGGPLVVPSAQFSGGWEQIGVVSWGVGGSCSSYTVFGRVSAFVPWIHGYTGAVNVFGDVNGSGCVDTSDEQAIIASFGQTVPPASPALDLTQDGVINIQDRLIVLQNFGQGCP
ncbi:DUF1986 domain-containing protein [Sorangium sp. So ce385]|uniref:DUF1986 domain-containing protein n=1 Tax=Sorangium sp. So ce385 TaxID=3133308 RepID=UPI003F5BF0C8